MAHGIDTNGTVSALNERLAGLRTELEAARDARDAAQVKAATNSGTQAEADRLDGEVQRLERSIAITAEAVAAVDKATVAIAGEVEEASEKRARDNLKRAGQNTREAVKALDAATDELVAAYVAARERIADLFRAADGATRRTDEFQTLQWLVPGLPAMILSRLAYRAPSILIPNISAGVDRDGPCPSVENRFEPVIAMIAPGPGRPKKPGGTAVPHAAASDSSAVAVADEHAARAAIEKDIAA